MALFIYVYVTWLLGSFITFIFLIVFIVCVHAFCHCFSLNHEGFASLEAKRKFRAPRITPVGCNSVHRGTTCLSTSVFSSGNLGNATPSNDSVSDIN